VCGGGGGERETSQEGGHQRAEKSTGAATRSKLQHEQVAHQRCNISVAASAPIFKDIRDTCS
jgi:hypothetical protein